MTTNLADLPRHRLHRALERETLATWLHAGVSLAEVERYSCTGLVGNQRRFSERAKRQFIRLWTWSAVRLTGSAGAAQDKLYHRGPDVLNRRIERAQRIIASLKRGA